MAYADFDLLAFRSIGREISFLEGKIIEITDTGVLFDENRRSLTSNPKPSFYNSKNISSLVSGEKGLLIGEYPNVDFFTKRLAVIFSSKFNPTVKKSLELKPNHDFSYCIRPGEYNIDRIVWVRNNDDKDRNSEPLELSFTIEKNKINYLGNIYMNSDSTLAKLRIYVSFKTP
ncbi:MAG: hypothetical protein BalsKO_13510 [Balneolaceae bacterium]